MVYVSFAQLAHAYEKMRALAVAAALDAGPAGPPPSAILIVVNALADPDALCAAHMLSVRDLAIWRTGARDAMRVAWHSMLKSDCLPHEILPVTGYDDLVAVGESRVANNDSLRCIVLINCGSMVAVEEVLSLPADGSVLAFILDSHRPFNLDNLYKTAKVVILDDGEAEEMQEIQEAFQTVEFPDDDEDDENSEQDADEDDRPDPLLDEDGDEDNDAV
ncbi:hypothetical protein HK405_001400, partial [Cladochytrium tenue]